jgi:hypothetical protein
MLLLCDGGWNFYMNCSSVHDIFCISNVILKIFVDVGELNSFWIPVLGFLQEMHTLNI